MRQAIMSLAAAMAACLPLACVLAAPVRALASPWETTAPEPASTFEIKGIVEHESSREESETVPALDITFPIRPDVLEVSVTTGAGQLRLADGTVLKGLTDTEVAAKWRVHDGGEAGFSFGVEPAVIVPSGDPDKVGDGAWRYVLPLLMQFNQGRMSYIANLAYENRFDGGEPEVSAGFVAEREMTDRFSLGVEIAAAAPTRAWNEVRVDANLGFTFKLSEKLELQGLIGRSVNGRDGGPVTLSRLFLEYAF